LTPEQWAEARRDWESDPMASYASVGNFSITWGEHEGVCAPLAVNLQGRWADNLLAPGDELRL
jgi:hypothetical protein